MWKDSIGQILLITVSDNYNTYSKKLKSNQQKF